MCVVCTELFAPDPAAGGEELNPQALGLRFVPGTAEQEAGRASGDGGAWKLHGKSGPRTALSLPGSRRGSRDHSKLPASGGSVRHRDSGRECLLGQATAVRVKGRCR